MKRWIITFVCLICLLSIGLGTQPKPVAAVGNTYYVSKTGSDSNPGTQAQPWLTLQKAANTVVAGDTVFIRSGIYNERLYILNTISRMYFKWKCLLNGDISKCFKLHNPEGAHFVL